MKNLLKILSLCLLFSSCSKKKDEEVLPTAPIYLEYANWKLTKISSKSDPSINRNLSECGTDVYVFKSGNIFIHENGNNCNFSRSFNGELYELDGYKMTFAYSNFDYPDGVATLAYSGNTMTWTFASGNSSLNLKNDYTLTFTEQ